MIGWLGRGPRWDQVPLSAVDLESTGLDAQRDEILSIGVVPIDHGAISWGSRWSERTQPLDHGRARSAAVGIHGILPAEAATARPLAETLDHFWQMIEGRILIVHFGALDVTLLRQAAARLGRPLPRFQYIDTVDMIRRLEHRRAAYDPRPLPRQLGAARQALGLPPLAEHDALSDALATAELFLLLRAKLGLTRLGSVLRRA